jgi:hypothetical protein
LLETVLLKGFAAVVVKFLEAVRAFLLTVASLLFTIELLLFAVTLLLRTIACFLILVRATGFLCFFDGRLLARGTPPRLCGSGDCQRNCQGHPESGP